jgi:TatD DNase family protein
VHAVVRQVPRNRLLVETDCPDQLPSGRPQGPNEPSFLIDIITRIAELRGESAEDVAHQTEANARALFLP